MHAKADLLLRYVLIGAEYTRDGQKRQANTADATPLDASFFL
ncbi:hypothetical protein [Reticulibacter mediterranei]|nr:hypothetical protein [Reticulibacter mediterranei]